MYDHRHADNLIACIRAVEPNPTFDSNIFFTACEAEIHALSHHGIADPIVVPTIIGLALFAFSICAGYVSLPNYRYRQNLTDYLRFRLTRALGSIDTASKWLQMQKEQYTGDLKNAQQTGGTAPVQSTYMRFAVLILSMPRGEATGDKLTIDECEGIEFFDDKSGWIYRKLYENHLDNAICQYFAAIMATVAIIGTIDLLGFDLIDLDSFQSWILKPLVVVIIMGILVPPSLAGLGRSIVCRNARKSIDRCVQNIQSQIGHKTAKDIQEELDRVRDTANSPPPPARATDEPNIPDKTG